jgi:hypothetical protein
VLYAVAWFLILALFAAWSTGVWLLHSLVVWSLTSLGTVAGQPLQIEHWPVPGWVNLWIQSDLILAVKATVEAVVPWVQSTGSALPSLAEWMVPLAWVVWGVGFLALALGGLALHAMISLTRRAAVQ